ncbi:MAG: hypothetical protein ACXWWC_02110, partial [Chitinophagaceae bacterium]
FLIKRQHSGKKVEFICSPGGLRFAITKLWVRQKCRWIFKIIFYEMIVPFPFLRIGPPAKWRIDTRFFGRSSSYFPLQNNEL